MSRRRILIIDDDNRNTFALSAVLRTRGFETRTAAGMEEAFHILKTDDDIEVVLMDIMMPEMDGYQAIAILKADSKLKHIPVIAVTAQAMQGDKEKCLAAGADDYISKPVDLDELLVILKKQ